MPSASGALETILFERSWVSSHDLRRARQYRGSGQSLAGSLIEIRVIEPKRLARALAEVYSLPVQAHLDDDALDVSLLSRIGAHYARKNRVLPLGTDGINVLIATADPSNYQPLDDLSTLFGMPVQLLVVPFDVLDRAIQRASQRTTERSVGRTIIRLEELPLETAASELDEARVVEIGADTPAVGRLVNALLWRALDERTKEILIEHVEGDLLVRFCADGTSHLVLSASRLPGEAITSCLKRMAGLSVEAVEVGYIRLCVAGRVIVLRMRAAADFCGERLMLQFPSRDSEFIDLIDRCEEALREVAADAPRVPMLALCGHCRTPLVVKDALFCKDCGVPLTRLAPFKKSLVELI
jgi:type IV pilus assembly protein PilB